MARRRSLSQRTGVIEFSVYKNSKEVEAIYIKVRNSKIVRSEEVGAHGEAVIDLDGRGQVVGIEMLEPGEFTLRQFKKLGREYDLGEVRNIRIDRLQEVFVGS